MKILRFRAVKRLRKYHVSIIYKTAVELTERTIATAEAFGLGIDGEKQFIICDTDIDVNEGDVVYITGDSGSGKSSILREFKKTFINDVADINELEIDINKPLVDSVEATIDEALRILSAVGLNDAFLFLRKFPELSDGQKYRYRLAKLIESKKKVWVCDEFCSTLDRDTAKIVSFNVQKIARQLGITVLVATCNLDLNADLNPSVRIDKRYGQEIKITYNTNVAAKECSLISEMHLEKGTYADWKILAPFHYRSHYAPPPKAIFNLIRQNERSERELCGVIVYSCPPLAVFGRKRFFNRPIKVAELNQILTIISRVVVHPKYRTIGLGQKIVRESLPQAPTRYTETVAVMAKYNPFFEKAGMRKIEEKALEEPIAKFNAFVKSLGFDVRYMSSEGYITRFLNEHPDTFEQIRKVLIMLATHLIFRKVVSAERFASNVDYKNAIANAPRDTIIHMIRTAGVMTQPKIYLVFDKEWLNVAKESAT